MNIFCYLFLREGFGILEIPLKARLNHVSYFFLSSSIKLPYFRITFIFTGFFTIPNFFSLNHHVPFYSGSCFWIVLPLRKRIIKKKFSLPLLVSLSLSSLLYFLPNKVGEGSDTLSVLNIIKGNMDSGEQGHRLWRPRVKRNRTFNLILLQLDRQLFPRLHAA